MTKKEAIAEMQKGNKVTHTNFSKEEWMTIENDKIKLEDDVICSQSEFWRWRMDLGWNNGYSLWEKPKN